RVEPEGAPGGALVVVDDREVLLQRALELPQGGDHRGGRAAVHEQQQGVVPVLAADVDPVPHAIDLDLVGLLHATGGDDAVELGDQGATRRVGLAVGAWIGGGGGGQPRGKAGKPGESGGAHGWVR